MPPLAQVGPVGVGVAVGVSVAVGVAVGVGVGVAVWPGTVFDDGTQSSRGPRTLKMSGPNWLSMKTSSGIGASGPAGFTR